MTEGRDKVLRILDIHIGCFGGIQNLKLSFKDGFQIIYGENEYGKSTIMSFIHLMLYGKNSKSRDLNQNLRKKYTPFNGSKMNGSMRWEIKGHSIRIDREFGKTQANDIIYVFNETLGTELPVPAGMEIGEYLLNMNEKIFDKVIFGGSPEGDMGTGAEEIMSGLVNMGAAGDKEVSAADILENLNAGMEQLKSKRGTSGSIPRISEEISRMNEEKSQLNQRKKELEQIRRSDISMVDKEKTLLRNLIIRLENERYPAEMQNRNESDGKRTEVNRGRRGLHFISAVVCLVSGILLIGNGKGIFGGEGYGYVAAFILFLAGTGFLAAAGRKSHVTVTEEESGEYSEKINELLDDLGYNGYSSEDLKARLWELEHSEEEDLSAMIQRIRQEIEDCQIRLTQLRKKREELTEEYEAYKITVSVMQECAAELRSTVFQPLNDMAGEIFFRLTDGRYDGFMVDEQYQIRVRERNDALYRVWKNLSMGTANQAYLSLRIAVNEMFSGQENMPLLLDDVLSNYDEKRAERAVQVLKERGGQVILFTCHRNLMQFSM
ncbi:MAG: AAA family ATPase [Lachnospiraceae bacterium]|nr:AAA family ATPase [Lachnospiraceae bacterium]